MTDRFVVGCINMRVDRQTRQRTPRTTLQLRAADLLQRADLTPRSIPPNAILIVRRLADPRPRSVALHQAHVSNSRWDRAVRQEIDDLYRRATRPDHGAIPYSAHAVLFADEAELLACLALDLCRDVAHTHWWWETWLRRWGMQTGSAPAAPLLMQHIQRLPGVFHLLDLWGAASDVVRTLDASATTDLLSALLTVFHLADFRTSTTLTAADDIRPARSVVEAEETGARTAHRTRRRHHRVGVAPPWTDYLTQAAASALTAEQSALLGLTLLLQRRGSLVHGQDFSAVARAWWQAVDTEVSSARPETQNRRIGAPMERRLPGRSAAAGEVNPIPPAGDATRVLPLVDRPAASSGLEPAKQPDRQPVFPVVPPASDTDRPRFPEPGEEVHNRQQVVAQQPDRHEEDDPVHGVTTDLGGVFYLVNMMMRLGWPACFEEDWKLASRVGAWGVLEILARGLLHATDDQYLYDPLWKVLARLDGRELETVVGGALLPPVVRRLPADWDRPLPIVSTGSDHAIPSALTAMLNLGVRQWLEMVLPYLRGRLRQTLVVDPAMPDKAMIEQLLCLRGRLFATTTHVDLMLRLEQIWMPVRLAGLDQDPGWLPHWGRVVQFHFQE